MCKRIKVNLSFKTSLIFLKRENAAIALFFNLNFFNFLMQSYCFFTNGFSLLNCYLLLKVFWKKPNTALNCVPVRIYDTVRSVWVFSNSLFYFTLKTNFNVRMKAANFNKIITEKRTPLFVKKFQFFLKFLILTLNSFYFCFSLYGIKNLFLCNLSFFFFLQNNQSNQKAKHTGLRKNNLDLLICNVANV